MLRTEVGHTQVLLMCSYAGFCSMGSAAFASLATSYAVHLFMFILCSNAAQVISYISLFQKHCICMATNFSFLHTMDSDPDPLL